MIPVGRSEADWRLEAAAPGPSAPVRTYIYRYLGIRRLGVLRVGLGRRRRFGRGRLFFWFVGGLPTSEEALDHVKCDGNEEDGDG